MKKIISLLLCICLILGATPINARASEVNTKYLQVFVNDQVHIYECLWDNEEVYCSVEDLAEMSGYSWDQIENSFEFFKTFESNDDLWTEIRTKVVVKVKDNQKKAEIEAMDETYSTDCYMEDGSLFLPLDKLLYLLHAELTIENDIAHVTPMPFNILDFMAVHKIDLGRLASTAEDVLIDTGWAFSDTQFGQLVYSTIAEVFNDFDGKIFMVWWPGEGHVETAECYENAILQLANDDENYIGEDVRIDAMEKAVDSVFAANNKSASKIQNIIAVPDNIDDIVQSVPDAVSVLGDLSKKFPKIKVSEKIKNISEKIESGEIDSSFLESPELKSKTDELGKFEDGLAILQCVWNAYNTADRVNGWDSEYLEQLQVLAEYDNPKNMNENVVEYVRSSAQRLINSYDNTNQAVATEALQSTLSLLLSKTFEESPFGKAFSILGAIGDCYGTFDVNSSDTYDVYAELSIVTFSIKIEQLVRDLFIYEDILDIKGKLTNESIEKARNQLMLYLRLNLRNKAQLYNLNTRGNKDKNWANSEEAKKLHDEIVDVYVMIAELVETKNSDSLLILDKDINEIHNDNLKNIIKDNYEIDVIDYLENPNYLSNVLTMEQISPWQFPNANSYTKDSFYLEIENSLFSMKNEGNEYVTLHGIKMGDPVEKAIKILEDNGWISYYSNENEHDFLATINGQNYFLSISNIKEGIVTFWYLNNWPEGDNIQEVLNGGKNTDDIPSEPWKKSYLDYINSHNQFTVSKLVNINNDDIPELYINFGTTASGDTICSFTNGKLIEQQLYNGGLSYLEGQNLFMDSGGHMDGYYNKIYTIENGQFILLYSGEFGAEDNANVQYDSSGMPIYNYYWDGVQVSSQEEYMNLLNQVYNTEQALSPYDNAEFSNGRYVGNGLCDYNEIIEAINNY